MRRILVAVRIGAGAAQANWQEHPCIARSTSPGLIGGCLFTHVEPWLDMEDERHLWYIDGIPDSMDKIRRSFRAVPHQFMFVGHFHRWQIADNFEILDWSGQEPIVLNNDRRYLIVCGAVCLGQCGIFDTDSRELIPINVETGAVRV